MLGYPHPDYLLKQLDARQILEWEAYFALAPFGQDYTDYLIAQLTSLFANANKRRGAKQREAADFLPYRKRPMRPEKIRETLQGILGRGSRS